MMQPERGPRASLPLVVDVDDVSDGGSVRVEPVWITYQVR